MTPNVINIISTETGKKTTRPVNTRSFVMPPNKDERPSVKDLDARRKQNNQIAIGVVIIVAAVAFVSLFVSLSSNAFANADERSVQMTSEAIKPEPMVFHNIDDVSEPEPPQNASEEELKAQEEMVKQINEREAQQQAEIDAKANEQKQEAALTTIQSSPSTGNSYSGSYFKKMGVIDENGWHYTWYSSNVKRHYRTGEWTPDENGIYRDSNGYVVVACVADKDGNAVSQGSIVPTPFGTGIVYDSGCDAGTIDVYVNF